MSHCWRCTEEALPGLKIYHLSNECPKDKAEREEREAAEEYERLKHRVRSLETRVTELELNNPNPT